MTSFNDLCEAYGFPLNPLKDYNDGKTFQRENAFLDHADLSEELVTILKHLFSLNVINILKSLLLNRDVT